MPRKAVRDGRAERKRDGAGSIRTSPTRPTAEAPPSRYAQTETARRDAHSTTKNRPTRARDAEARVAEDVSYGAGLVGKNVVRPLIGDPFSRVGARNRAVSGPYHRPDCVMVVTLGQGYRGFCESA